MSIHAFELTPFVEKIFKDKPKIQVKQALALMAYGYSKNDVNFSMSEVVELSLSHCSAPIQFVNFLPGGVHRSL